MKRPLRVIILWHMHQPNYVNPDTDHSLMPWVRMHAIKDYYDMGRIVEQVPGAKAVFNFVPSLWEQLLRMSDGDWLDEYELVCRKRESELSKEEVLFIGKYLFSCVYDTMIRPYPSYEQLFERFGPNAPADQILSASEQNLRDIQVWFHLAWCNHELQSRSNIKALIEQGSGFSFEQKLELLDTLRAFLSEIPDLYRKLSEQGAVEVSTTPFFHPILPLLLDPDSAHIACPGMELPEGRYPLPNDAKLHVERAIVSHKELFGSVPIGFWPAEGSVSPLAAQLFRENGVQWIATDEENLRLSLGLPKMNAEEKYRLYTHSGVHIFFRDHGLSDRIGFNYQHFEPTAAVDDFLHHLRSIHRALPEWGDFAVPVILDGENCWEFYPEQGRPFLLEFYQRLTEADDIELLTFSDLLSQQPESFELPYLHSGSWIDANFTTWVGDPVKNQAWSHFYQARRRCQAYLDDPNLSSEQRENILEQILVAEGSDWFWWFGEGHTSEYDELFDALFRKRLIAIYNALGETPPDALHEPIDNRWEMDRAYILPTHSIHPRINGRTDSYWEWLSAGACYPQGGSMQRSTILIKKLSFGFNEHSLYLRIESNQLRELIEGKRVLQILFTRPEMRTFSIPLLQSKTRGAIEQDVLFAINQCVEISIPFISLDPDFEAGDPINFYVAISDDSHELERLPSGAPIHLPFPSETFDEEDWQV